MAIPSYQKFMFPLLKSLEDGKLHKFTDLVGKLKNESGLSDEDKHLLLPSQRQPVVDNRIGWARLYLKKAGLIVDPERGMLKIAPEGVAVLKSDLEAIDVKFLKQYQSFNDFLKGTSEKSVVGQEEPSEKTPDELMEQGYEEKYNELAVTMLESLRTNSPEFFENVVLDLLTKMGYGEGKVTGRSGDGGVDGIINQDALGLEKVFFQAKRFADGNPVSASMVRDFVGTLEVQGVSKGVFITTSRFPKNALEVLAKTQKRIVLVDGPKLVDLMISYDLGVILLQRSIPSRLWT